MNPRVLSAPLLADSRIADQIRSEQESRAQGIARYWKQAQQAVERGEGAMLQPAQRLIVSWMPAMIEVSAKEIRECKAGKPASNRHNYAPIIIQLEPEKFAAAALSAMMSELMLNNDGIASTRLGYAVGRAVVSEVHADIIYKQSQEWRASERKKMKEQGDEYLQPADDHDIWKQMIHSARKINPRIVNRQAGKHLDDPIRQRKAITAMGLWFITEAWMNCVIRDKEGEIRPSFINKKEHKKVGNKHHVVHWFRIHPETALSIHDAHLQRQVLHPSYAPMKVSPYPWQVGESGTLADGVQGGYVSIRTPLVSRPYPVQKSAYRTAKMPELLDCLNIVSSTGWKINPTISKVVKHLWDGGGGQLGIPSRERATKPPVPSDIDTNPAASLAYRKVASEWYDSEIRAGSDRTTFVNRLGVASSAGDDEMFFPQKLDFRTRTYPIPSHLNHQGPDICRGLLEFSESHEPGTRGTYWLAIHAANCYGVDRVTFDERVQWTHDHLDEIHRCAKDPLGTDFWHNADDGKKPWQFLAACMAIVNPDRAASLPLQWDGTCNAFQNYVGLTLDTETASMVNMVGNDRPADFYSVIAEKVKHEVYGQPELRQHAHLVTRKMVKPPVMTSAYGVTMVGIREQVHDYLIEKWVDQAVSFKLSRDLSKIIVKAVRDTCTAVTESMDYLCLLAKLVCKKDKDVRWTTPLGFPVIQWYSKPSKRRIVFGAKSYHIDLYPEGKKVKAGQQASSFPPNFVHSLDATHMFMVARAIKRPFAATHDCYLGHAAFADQLHETIRDQFIRLYSVDRMKELHDSLERHAGISLPEPPKRGTYNLESLRTSPYAFH